MAPRQSRAFCSLFLGKNFKIWISFAFFIASLYIHIYPKQRTLGRSQAVVALVRRGACSNAQLETVGGVTALTATVLCGDRAAAKGLVSCEAAFRFPKAAKKVKATKGLEVAVPTMRPRAYSGESLSRKSTPAGRSSQVSLPLSLSLSRSKREPL